MRSTLTRLGLEGLGLARGRKPNMEEQKMKKQMLMVGLLMVALIVPGALAYSVPAPEPGFCIVIIDEEGKANARLVSAAEGDLITQSNTPRLLWKMHTKRIYMQERLCPIIGTNKQLWWNLRHD